MKVNDTDKPTVNDTEIKRTITGIKDIQITGHHESCRGEIR